MRIVNPPELSRARGFSHGVVAPAAGRLLFVAGQTAADDAGRVIDLDFAGQFATALGRVLHVVRAAGGGPPHIMRMTVYVTDMQLYLASRASLTGIWKQHMGTHYPAMALVQVTGLVDEGALVEIQADAVLP